jgi:type VI secretion system protein ImpJ
MLNQPVHWYEGMFLRPQHFQAAERSWSEQLSLAGRFDNPYNYGLREISYSHDAIPNGKFELQRCEARMPDGTLISLDTGQTPGRIDLAGAFTAGPTVTLYLATPRLNLGRPNVLAPIEGQPPARYAPMDLSVQDESAGGNAQDVQFRGLNVRLLLSTDDLSGYDVLPIARLRRGTEMQPKPVVDATYFPPMLSTSAWTDLDRGIIRAIYDIISQKVTVLAEQVRSRSITLAAQEPGDLDRVFMLQILNEAVGKLSCLAFSPGIHPLPMYAELCRIIGALAVFSEERTLNDYPAYNHDDLWTIFDWAKKKIEGLINRIRNYGYEQRPFLGQAARKRMRVELDPKWLGREWDWYVGINAFETSRNEVVNVLDAQGHNWKLGSEERVEEMFTYRREGLRLRMLEQAPRALPPRGNWIYFQVSRGNAAWDDVVKNETLAIRFKDELIANLGALDGSQRVDLRVKQAIVPLEFSLFAVPVQMS